MKLESVLETVLYHASGEEDELARFYGDVLELPRIGGGLTFRVGPGMLLLFNRERSSVQSTPPPHGASGRVHTCFVASADDYERWKQRVADHGIPILEERTWDNGVRSFYFHDPAGNVLEIADGDLWPRV
jgi:catechol 2,3-dioxygenase-like lactoylglutathione lyase family enzyme